MKPLIQSIVDEVGNMWDTFGASSSTITCAPSDLLISSFPLVMLANSDRDKVRDLSLGALGKMQFIIEGRLPRGLAEDVAMHFMCMFEIGVRRGTGDALKYVAKHAENVSHSYITEHGMTRPSEDRLHPVPHHDDLGPIYDCDCG